MFLFVQIIQLVLQNVDRSILKSPDYQYAYSVTFGIVSALFSYVALPVIGYLLINHFISEASKALSKSKVD